MWVGIASILIGTAWAFVGLGRSKLRLALMGFAALGFGMAMVLGAPVRRNVHNHRHTATA